MQKTYIGMVSTIQVSIINKIKDTFEEDTTIEFNDPITLYLSRNIGGVYVKVPYLCNTLSNGTILGCSDPSNISQKKVSLYDIENPMEVGLILDLITEGKYRITVPA